MRICLVSREYPPEGTGGIAAYVYTLAHGLTKAGHEVTVIAGTAGACETAKSPDPCSSPRVYRVATHQRLPLPALVRHKGRGIWNLLEHSWTIDRTIAHLERTQGPFDVVEMPNWGAEALIYSFHPRAPLVIRLSTPLAVLYPLTGRSLARIGFRIHKYLEGLPVCRAHCIIAHSRFTANYCADLYGFPVAQARVIPQGIKAPDLVSETPTSQDTTVTVLFVGRLEPRKGIDYLLQAIPQVVGSVPQVRFVIAGKDIGPAPQGASYQEYFASFATPEAIKATTFLGYVDDRALAQLYAACDIFVAPSLSESFGLIYIEAMVHAKPVVAFRAAAIPEVVEHGVTGLLAALKDVPSLANALTTLAQDGELRRDMGRRGYQRAITKFSAQGMVEATLACYQQLQKTAQ